ncbi:MAG: pyruvate kinase [Candidatus Kapabacteria bacterium]|nr:pyruvate kinase [Ignavibacteriota bacterium]MCW5884171.1 pyruvate kinase [Candidatus Kapabacteria bacterium]
MIPRKTKIICTIGPASEDIETLTMLIRKGMDIARLNFSHGSHESHANLIANIRKASVEAGRQVAILQDLQGPKIRIENVENGSVFIQDGDSLIITTEDLEIGNSEIVSTSYKDLHKDLKVGNTLLLDDGYLILTVEKIAGERIYTKIIKGGELKSRKGIIAPGVTFSAPSLSEKDMEDLKFGLSMGIDVVALSFVRSVRDIIELKTTMRIFGRPVPIIAKIERPEALKSINEIIAEVDGIMVARGDLGLELPPEEVPLIQKDIIKRSNYFGKPVITATQMLESMVTNPRPTRAEASDVANAVLDGTDCVMLSAETGTGRYPLESVDYMYRIIKNIEDKFSRTDLQRVDVPSEESDVSDAIGKAACLLAGQVKATAIITLTSSTLTTKKIAKYRPDVPIIAITNDDHVHRRLNFVWGVTSLYVKDDTDFVQNFESLKPYLLDLDFINPGDLIVFVSGLTETSFGNDNLLKLFYV